MALISDNLKAGAAEYRRKLAAGEVKRLTPLEKAHANPGSLRAAINGMCYDCNGAEDHINRTRNCEIVGCPLWNVRPFQVNLRV